MWDTPTDITWMVHNNIAVTCAWPSAIPEHNGWADPALMRGYDMNYLQKMKHDDPYLKKEVLFRSGKNQVTISCVGSNVFPKN